jgi:hypothetical protein
MSAYVCLPLIENRGKTDGPGKTDGLESSVGCRGGIAIGRGEAGWPGLTIQAGLLSDLLIVIRDFKKKRL